MDPSDPAVLRRTQYDKFGHDKYGRVFREANIKAE